MQTLKALSDYVIVIKHRDLTRQNKSKIILPNKQFFKLCEASEVCEVVSVGERYKQTYGNGQKLNVGDFVLCEHLEGLKFFYDKKEYWKMKSRFVLAKIDKESIDSIGTCNPSINDKEWEGCKDQLRNKGVKI